MIQKKILHYFGFLFLLGGCQGVENQNPNEDHAYFPLHDFFQKQVKELSATDPIVEKTVNHDKDIESKTLKIKDWETELGNFLAIDINKDAYRDQFSIDSAESKTIYTAKDKKLNVQKIVLQFDTSRSLQKIEINTITDNFLYQNSETLVFEVGKSYSLDKKQNIFMLGDTNYLITGTFTNPKKKH